MKKYLYISLSFGMSELPLKSIARRMTIQQAPPRGVVSQNTLASSSAQLMRYWLDRHGYPCSPAYIDGVFHHMPLWQKRKNGRTTSLWSVSWKSVNIMYNSVLEDSPIAITWHIVWHSNAIFFAWYSRTKHHKNSLASKTLGIDLLGMKRGESKRELKEIFTVDSSRFKESYTAASSLPKGGRITKHLASGFVHNGKANHKNNSSSKNKNRNHNATTTTTTTTKY